ncbi:MAG: pilin [Candidatus Magasanikbacteria bacterium]
MIKKLKFYIIILVILTLLPSFVFGQGKCICFRTIKKKVTVDSINENDLNPPQGKSQKEEARFLCNLYENQQEYSNCNWKELSTNCNCDKTKTKKEEANLEKKREVECRAFEKANKQKFNRCKWKEPKKKKEEKKGKKDNKKSKRKKVSLDNPLQGDIKTVPALAGRVIKTILSVIGSVALIAFVVGGVRWLISGGKPEQIKKGAKTMLYAVVGLFVVFGSYGILQLIIKTLKNGTG